MEVQDRRRRTTLSDQLSAAAIDPPPCSAFKLMASSSSPNLGDLLKVRQEEDLPPQLPECRRRSASITLGAFLAYEKQDLPRGGLAAVTAAVIRSRTLLDVIRDEEESRGGVGAYDGVLTEGANAGDKNNWRRAFKERLRIRRLGNHVDGLPAAGPTPPAPAAASPPTTPVPEGNDPVQAGGDATPPTQPQPPTQVAAAGSPNEADGTIHGGGSPATATTVEAQEQQQVRVSLMALLEQTDRQGGRPGFAASSPSADVGQEEDEADEEGKSYDAKCCVCMVRRKGAAFIPCGHTFCRLCSRRLWVSRGSCPLCNGSILEVLDIF